MSIDALIGKTILSIEGLKRYSGKVIFRCDDGKSYKMHHWQACCESVSIEDIDGDIQDLLGSPVLSASEKTSEENPPGIKIEYQDSFTWTFYKIATIKGSVTIRWYGASNGYYSESVDFEEQE